MFALFSHIDIVILIVLDSIGGFCCSAQLVTQSLFRTSLHAVCSSLLLFPECGLILLHTHRVHFSLLEFLIKYEGYVTCKISISNENICL